MGAKTIPTIQREQNVQAGTSATTSAMTKAFYTNLQIRRDQVKTVIRLRATTAHR